MKTESFVDLKVADEVWIVAALLQRELPDKSDFTIDEIVERAQRENLTGKLRPGIYPHVVQHCVANRAPNSGRYRMLVETSTGHRRLFRQGDSYHSLREGAKTIPAREDIPAEYESMLDWYRDWSRNSSNDSIKNDPLLALRGSGKHIWADEHADDYIRRLRQGWE
jgi:hypothetical protein